MNIEVRYLSKSGNTNQIFYAIKFIVIIFLPVIIVISAGLTAIVWQRYEDEKLISVFVREASKEAGIECKIKYANFTGIYNYDLHITNSLDKYNADTYFADVCKIIKGTRDRIISANQTELLRSGYTIRTRVSQCYIDFEYKSRESVEMITNLFCDYSAFESLNDNGVKLIVDAQNFTKEQIKAVSTNLNYKKIDINIKNI